MGWVTQSWAAKSSRSRARRCSGRALGLFVSLARLCRSVIAVVDRDVAAVIAPFHGGRQHLSELAAPARSRPGVNEPPAEPAQH